jgi:hypothetical protein
MELDQDLKLRLRMLEKRLLQLLDQLEALDRRQEMTNLHLLVVEECLIRALSPQSANQNQQPEKKKEHPSFVRLVDPPPESQEE